MKSAARVVVICRLANREKYLEQIIRIMIMIMIMVISATFNNMSVSYIVAVSFIGGGNRSTRRSKIHPQFGYLYQHRN